MEKLLEKEVATEEIVGAIDKEEVQEESLAENSIATVEVKENDCESFECEQEECEQAESQEYSEEENDNVLRDLSEFARLLSTSVEDLKEEFYITQITKLMSRIQKVIVRYDITEKELESLFRGAGYYGLGGITVAPAYLTSCLKQNKKSNFVKQDITSLIDFPFGESSLKGKVVNIKESMKAGASSVAVAVPSMMLNKENKKLLKKECRKYFNASKKRAGIVLNASDVNEENFAEAIKTLKKVKISYIILAFSDATIDEVKTKLSIVTKGGCGKGKKLYVLANVEKIETAAELFKLGVDNVLTPYADAIGSDLVKRFNLIIK